MILLLNNYSGEGFDVMLIGDNLVKRARKLNPNIVALESEKPEFWIISITAELLKIGLEEYSSQWNDIKRGITFKKSSDISESQFLKWFDIKTTDADNLVKAVRNIFDTDFNDALNFENDEIKIYKCASAIVNLQKICKEMIKWEESVKFIRCPTEFLLLKSCLAGLIGDVLDVVFSLHEILASRKFNLLSGKNGKYWEVDVSFFSLPDDWHDKINGLVKEAVFEIELKKFMNRDIV